jgi:hypothetical protein
MARTEAKKPPSPPTLIIKLRGEHLTPESAPEAVKPGAVKLKGVKPKAIKKK